MRSVSCGVVLCGERVFLVYCGAVWRGVAWRGVAWRGVAWRGVAWRGMNFGQAILSMLKSVES